MKGKMFKSTALLVSLSVLLTFITMSSVLYNKTYEQMTRSVRDECAYVKEALEKIGDSYLDEAVGQLTSSRITLLDTDGTVLYDSNGEIQTAENHSQRPEIKEAAEKGESSVERYSTTLEHQTFYCAMRLTNGKIVRVAATTESVFKVMASSMSLLLVLIGAVVTLSPLLGRIYQQNQQIESQTKKIKRSQKEFQAITENIKDGLIVTNQSVILSINQAAKRFLGVSGRDCVNCEIPSVSEEPALKEVLACALKGSFAERVIESSGIVLQLTANPVSVAGAVKGAVILLRDITETYRAEQMRREFSANVSHELKTPLMSISGYAELIENGMVQPEDLCEFAGRIHQEAHRLSMLVEDIIRLSSLDERSDFPMENVDLKKLAQEVQTHLSEKAEAGGIRWSAELREAKITGVRQILYEIIYNLCDNALIYNKSEGEISVKIWEKGQNVYLCVKDTGIGIAPEDQERIFERFYRVDKSHSRATGGTGLGLSIVKHGAALHHAKIQVNSRLGEGTEITIVFPKE